MQKANISEEQICDILNLTRNELQKLIESQKSNMIQLRKIEEHKIMTKIAESLGAVYIYIYIYRKI